MASFFKLVLHGILYALGLPVFLVVLAIYSIYCFIMFIYEAIRSFFVFFSGGTPFGDLKEDVKAKEILLAKQQQELQPQPQVQQPVGNTFYIFQGRPADPNNPTPTVDPLDFGGAIDMNDLRQITGQQPQQPNQIPNNNQNNNNGEGGNQ